MFVSTELDAAFFHTRRYGTWFIYTYPVLQYNFYPLFCLAFKGCASAIVQVWTRRWLWRKEMTRMVHVLPMCLHHGGRGINGVNPKTFFWFLLVLYVLMILDRMRSHGRRNNSSTTLQVWQANCPVISFMSFRSPTCYPDLKSMPSITHHTHHTFSLSARPTKTYISAIICNSSWP